MNASKNYAHESKIYFHYIFRRNINSRSRLTVKNKVKNQLSLDKKPHLIPYQLEARIMVSFKTTFQQRWKNSLSFYSVFDVFFKRYSHRKWNTKTSLKGGNGIFSSKNRVLTLRVSHRTELFESEFLSNTLFGIKFLSEGLIKEERQKIKIKINIQQNEMRRMWKMKLFKMTGGLNGKVASVKNVSKWIFFFCSLPLYTFIKLFLSTENLYNAHTFYYGKKFWTT